jgi:hypothetical protein
LRGKLDCGGNSIAGETRLRGKLDCDAPAPEYQVSALLRVVVAQARDRAPPPAQILEVLVRNGANPRPEVEGDCTERGALEWASKTSRAVLLDELEDSGAERPQLNRVLLEDAYQSIVSGGQGKRPKELTANVAG